MNSERELKRTALFEKHKKMCARMIPFAGWEMPVFYKGILEEVLSVRERVGVFDVSHMGEIIVQGESAEEFLQKLCSNDIKTLKPLKARYSFFLNEKGGFIDDLIVYRIDEKRFLLCVNAINREKDYEWLKEHKRGMVFIEDVTEVYSLLSVQGPLSEKIVTSLFENEKLRDLTFYSFIIIEEGGHPVIISRTGYTGEDGFEIFYPKKPDVLWEKIIEMGACPAGLGARDTLRIEAFYPLYGHEIWEENTPLEAGLMRFVDMNKDFIGKSALENRKTEEKLIAFSLFSKNVPREGDILFSNGEEIGRVTSGTFSPVLKRGIGMGYIKRDYQLREVFVEIRENKIKAEMVSPPFVPYRVKRGGKK